MRIVHNKERTQRGCVYCADRITHDESGKKLHQKMCPYGECPYHELDGFENYGEFLKSKGSGTMAAIMRELGMGPL